MLHVSAATVPESRPRTATSPRAGDRLVVAVADGHGGAARRGCAARLEPLVRDAPIDAEALRRAFRALHAECARLDDCSGAALTVCAIDEATGEFACANVGDVHCMLVTPTSYLWMSTSHRLQDNAAERARLADHVRVDAGPPRLFPGGLACARSVGDVDCPHASCEPDVAHGVLVDGAVLVLASDGVWDALPARRVVARARRGPPERSCTGTDSRTTPPSSRSPPPAGDAVALERHLPSHLECLVDVVGRGCHCRPRATVRKTKASRRQTTASVSKQQNVHVPHALPGARMPRVGRMVPRRPAPRGDACGLSLGRGTSRVSASNVTTIISLSVAQTVPPANVAPNRQV